LCDTVEQLFTHLSSLGVKWSQVQILSARPRDSCLELRRFAVTGVDGAFRIEGVVPGRYRLFAERAGFLEVEKHHPRSEGRILTLSAGQELKDLLVRLQASAVVVGRVTDEDGDPLPNAQVAVLRQRFVSGHSRFEQASAERTNDLGEYRITDLAAGSYFVSVSPPPNFKNLIETASGVSPVEPRDSAGAPDKPLPTSSNWNVPPKAVLVRRGIHETRSVVYSMRYFASGTPSRVN